MLIPFIPSIRDKPNHMKKLVFLFLLAPLFLFGQSNQDATVSKDTVGIDEVEWIDYYTLHQKETNKPFTGVVKFDGQLNTGNSSRSKRKGRFLQDTSFVSTVNFVSGKAKGIYTVWGKENGQKKSEITLAVVQRSSGYGLKLVGNGPYTHWYKNGQMAIKGRFINGKKSSRNRVWYKNGQLKTEAYYNFGTPSGRFIIWDENGEKSYERYFYNRKVIRRIERDKNGKIVKEWPEIDKDSSGLKIFINEVISILKSKDYDALEKLIISKEDFIKIQLGDTKKDISNQVKEINEGWSKHISKSMDKTKKERVWKRLEKETISTIIYDYKLINKDKSSKKIKWPKSVNFDFTKAALVVAEVTILLADYSSWKIKMNLLYVNNRWCFMFGGSLVDVEYMN